MGESEEPTEITVQFDRGRVGIAARGFAAKAIAVGAAVVSVLVALARLI